MAHKDDVGRRGEDIAAQWAHRRGWEVLDRNWRCRAGELDLVARDGATIVVVEVKTRTGTVMGHPAEAVTPVKLARLRRLAGEWLATHEARASDVRLDVVAVLLPAVGPVRLSHLQAVG